VEEVKEVIGSYYSCIKVRLGLIVLEARLISLVLRQLVRGVSHK
jgi:hypothetical protein